MTTQAEQAMNERNYEFNTICRDCIFATWYDDVQEDCELNRIEKFHEHNEVSLENEGDKQYYKINTICNACRNKEWFEREKENGIEDPKKNLWDQLSNQYDIVLTAYVSPYDSKVINVDKILSTIESAKNQSLQPKSIIVVCNDIYVSYVKLFNKIKDKLSDTDIKYELVRVLDESDFRACIDKGVTKCKGLYYSVFLPGYDIPTDFIEKLNNLANKEMVQFSMVEPIETSNGLTIQRQLHTLLHGNKAMKIEDKIRELAQEQNVKHMIRKW